MKTKLLGLFLLGFTCFGQQINLATQSQNANLTGFTVTAPITTVTTNPSTCSVVGQMVLNTTNSVLYFASAISPCTWTPIGAVGGFYQTVQVNGSSQTQRANLNLAAGANCTLTPSDSGGTNTTNVTITCSGGAGGGATYAIPTNVAAGTLTVGPCSTSVPCNIAPGNVLTSFTATPTVSTTSGTANDTLFGYVSGSTFTIGYNSANVYSCTNCTLAPSISAIPAQTYPVMQCPVISGVIQNCTPLSTPFSNTFYAQTGNGVDTSVVNGVLTFRTDYTPRTNTTNSDSLQSTDCGKIVQETFAGTVNLGVPMGNQGGSFLPGCYIWVIPGTSTNINATLSGASFYNFNNNTQASPISFTTPYLFDVRDSSGNWLVGTLFNTTTGGVSIGGAVSGGTANSVLFVNSAGNLGQDNPVFNWNDSTYQLSVENTTGSTNPGFTVGYTGTTSGNVFGRYNLNTSGGNLGALTVLGSNFTTNGIFTASGIWLQNYGVSGSDLGLATSVGTIKFATGNGTPPVVHSGVTQGGLTFLDIGSAIASAATIAPTSGIVHITGTTQINTITPPTGCTTTGFGCLLRLIPDGAFTTGTSGNIAIASTAVVSKVLILIYDPSTSKWYPSY